MSKRMWTPFGSVVAGALACMVSAGPLAAQQGQAVDPQSPLFGRPDNEQASKLAPIPVPPLALSVDKIPTGKLRVPRGFKVELWAAGSELGFKHPRTLRIGDNGTVFVGTRNLGQVFAITEKGGKKEVKTIVKDGMKTANGLAFHRGTLYVAETTKVWKFDDIENKLDNPGAPQLVYDQLPMQEAHGWKYIGVGPDNKLYIAVGAPCNICMPAEGTAEIRRINLDGSGMEVVARGVRNSVGFDWHPQTKELWFTDNGRDWFSEDVPEEELNRVSQTGKHFGFPHCHQGNLPDNEFGWGRTCSEFEKPVALLGAHAAALGMRFYTGTMFPADYRGQIFVARRGAWNRSVKTGGDVVVVKLNKDGGLRSVEPFVTGFIENNNYVGRPVDVAVMKDGSLLVSDEFASAIYRISYSGGSGGGGSGGEARRAN